MDLLVPPDEVRDALLDADLGPVVELALGPPQVGGRQPHVPRLVGVPLDPHASPQGPSDQLDQPVQPHARARSSRARLLAAYGEIGQPAAASSANGAGVASPSTDDDPNTTLPIPARRAASNTRTVPVTFASL